MKKPSEVLDVPAIQNEIRTKHQNFVKKYGGTIEKVLADHRLLADIVMAKLHRILVIFKEENIIDEIKMADKGPYKKTILCKSGFDTYVEIETNGMVIVLSGYAYTTGIDSDFHYIKKTFRDASNKDFDWISFSNELVDYIHATIYERKEVIEQRLYGILGNDISKEEVEKVMKKK